MHKADEDKHGCLAIQHALEMAPLEMQCLIGSELKGKVSPGCQYIIFVALGSLVPAAGLAHLALFCKGYGYHAPTLVLPRRCCL